MQWLNIFGLVLLLLLLAPNLVFALRGGAMSQSKKESRALHIAEQIGRFGTMFLLVFNIGIFEFGFASDELFAVWLIACAVLLAAYWACWGFFLHRPAKGVAIALAVLPSALFILTGLFSRHWLLLGFALLFSIAHIIITAGSFADE